MRRFISRACAAVAIAGVVGLCPGWTAPALANRGGSPDDTDSSTTTTTMVVREADLMVTKAASASVAVPGLPLIYTITITNQGPADEPAVFLTDQLPANTTFDQVSPTPACGAQGAIVTCQLGPLAAGASIVVTVAVTVSAAAPPGDLINTAIVTGADPSTDPDPNNNSDTATSTVPAAVAITAGGGDTPLVGQPAGDPPSQGGTPLVLGTELPRTGSRTLDGQIITALALIAAGLPVLYATRRRRDRRA